MNTSETNNRNPTTLAIEIAIRLGIIFLILAWCFQIITPFIGLVTWGAIIAVAIYNPFLKLADKLGGRKKLAITLIVVVSLAAILVPVISLTTSILDNATQISEQIKTDTVQISPPSESVQDWPLVGKKVYGLWHQASVDLSALLQKYPEHVKTVGIKFLGFAKSASFGVLQFIISMLIAAAFLANAEPIRAALEKVADRLIDGGGGNILDLSIATIRSVAVGVIGIATVQALLGGLGMMFAGVPLAGLLTIAVLVLAIAQLPPILVLLPVAIYVFSVESTTVGVIFLVWSILVSFSDAVLKPMFLGRGVDAPMLVILLGAIGGMISSGIVGLFIGAIILALGYTLFQTWLNRGDSDSATPVTTDTHIPEHT